MARESAVAEPCVLLPWDGEFWGFPVGQVRSNTLSPDDLHGIDGWCQSRSIACLYFLADSDSPDTVRTAEDGGFRLVDVRVTLGRYSDQIASAAGFEGFREVTIRAALITDKEALRRIAAVSHCDTRFFFDRNFPPAESEALYEHWITASCSGFADRVLVGELAGEPVGYVTCHLPVDGEPAGRIGLLGVAEAARGRGLGTMLVLKALDWFGSQRVGRVTVVTQGRNIAAQALYQRCGFVTQSQQLWYHKWYCLSGKGTM